MYHFIQAWATTASLLTVVSGYPQTFLPQSPNLLNPVHLDSQYLLNDSDSNQFLAQESEPKSEPKSEPEAEETPKPTESPSPEPEATPEPTETPTPEATPEPTATPTPEATPEPTDTPSPRETSEPVNQPEMPTEEPAEAEATELILDTQGELVEGDEVLESDNSLYDEYTFDGKEDQQVTITLESSSFDTYLAVFTPDNKLLKEHDDVSQTNSNSEINVTLPTTGTYRVIVNSYDDKGRGTYNLKIR